MLFKKYHYITSASKPLAEHFYVLADEIYTEYIKSPNDLVVEIGSNDGTLLQFFKDYGMNYVLGVDPAKDADGLHPMNLGRLVAGYEAPLPCTPRGIVALLNHYSVPLQGAEVVVIGRGLTVGRPLGLLLTRKQENATVTLTHTGTKDLAAHTRRADIVIAAIGQAHFLKAEMIKPGAAVLDVGISRTDAGLLGDIDPGVREVASWIAPMPGGVGPMTRAMLLQNVVEACER